MANPQHLALVVDVDAWNRWRQSNRNIQPDLSRANLSWRQLQGIDLSEALLEEIDLNGARLEGANLSRANLQGANLVRAQLEGADLGGAQLKNAKLDEANLQGANFRWVVQSEAVCLREAQLNKADFRKAELQAADFSGAKLQGANFGEANLQRADFRKAELQGVNFRGANLQTANFSETKLQQVDLRESKLQGANLQLVFFDTTTRLDGATLGDVEYGFASLADASWSGVNLTVIDWTLIEIVGDETNTRQPRMGKRDKDKAYRLAVRANRQLSVVLRDQGLNEEADHFAYRALLIQRSAWRLQRRPLKYIFSCFLYLLAGYGYRPLRSLFWYVLTISVFALAYYQAWAYYHLERTTKHSLSYVGAIIFSITAFHGRGFFLGGDLGYDSLITILGAAEAVIGLLIELSFIATFTGRFFRR